MANLGVFKYKFLTKELLEKEYLEFKDFKKISQKYNIERSIIERYCKHYGIKIIPKIKYSFDKDFFKNESEEVFWLVGFIAADGCVICHKSKEPNVLTIGLARKDEEILVKIKKLLKFEGPTKYLTRCLNKLNPNWNDSEQVRFSLYSKEIIKDLEKFGIGPRKSLTYEFPEFLKTHPLRKHFIRGYFDGDGSFFITKTKRKNKNGNVSCSQKMTFALRGTVNFLNDVGNLLKNDAKFESIVTAKQYKNCKIGEMKFSGNKIVSKISHYFYDDANIYLERKKEKVQNLL